MRSLLCYETKEAVSKCVKARALVTEYWEGQLAILGSDDELKWA
jgi:hypothetical protein